MWNNKEEGTISDYEEGSFERDPSIFTPPSPLHIPDGFKPEDVSEEAFEEVATDLINTVILEICFNMHQAAKRELDKDNNKSENEKNEDIYGTKKTSHFFNCPHCGKKTEARRFTLHLNKCMHGISRLSGRSAQRKTVDVKINYNQDHEDSDSSHSSKKKPKRKYSKVANQKRVRNKKRKEEDL